MTETYDRSWAPGIIKMAKSGAYDEAEMGKLAEDSKKQAAELRDYIIAKALKGSLHE